MAKDTTLLGILLMLAFCALAPLLDVAAKLAAENGVPVGQITTARFVVQTALMLPVVLVLRLSIRLSPRALAFASLRALFLLVSTYAFVSGIEVMPIADALAIFFVNPLVIVILSALVLRETVGPHRWAAVAVGFVGMLIIIRPGMVEVNPGTFYALGAGVALGSYLVMTRHIAGSADAMVLTFQTSAIGAGLMTLALPFVWHTPTPGQWVMLAGLGVVATLGHMLITKAYEHGEASLLAPLAFTEILMATVFGWWFFGDLPDRWTVLGVTVLVASAIYISIRERRASAA